MLETAPLGVGSERSEGWLQSLSQVKIRQHAGNLVRHGCGHADRCRRCCPEVHVQSSPTGLLALPARLSSYRAVLSAALKDPGWIHTYVHTCLHVGKYLGMLMCHQYRVSSRISLACRHASPAPAEEHGKSLPSPMCVRDQKSLTTTS